ncbi:hypothetical protein FQZ97_591300 [compost metagenome]
MAGSNSLAKGSLPKRSDKAFQPATWPGTVTVPQPVAGIASRPPKYSGVHAAGAQPLEFRPCRRPSCQTSANMSPPMPFMTGSSTVSAIAVAMALSTALPPASSMRRPACAARGWLVATALAARTGIFLEA